MTDKPKTMAEWNTYIKNLIGTDLFNQAVTAATPIFADKMEEEGYEASQITQIRLAYANQLILSGQGLPTFLPEPGSVNYESLINNPIYDIDEFENE